MFCGETSEVKKHSNERRTNVMKKLIALILSLYMLLGMLPAIAETAVEAPAETEKVDMNHTTNGKRLSPARETALAV